MRGSRRAEASARHLAIEGPLQYQYCRARNQPHPGEGHGCGDDAVEGRPNGAAHHCHVDVVDVLQDGLFPCRARSCQRRAKTSALALFRNCWRVRSSRGCSAVVRLMRAQRAKRLSARARARRAFQIMTARRRACPSLSVLLAALDPHAATLAEGRRERRTWVLGRNSDGAGGARALEPRLGSSDGVGARQAAPASCKPWRPPRPNRMRDQHSGHDRCISMQRPGARQAPGTFQVPCSASVSPLFG
jgi:hypothetical protein